MTVPRKLRKVHQCVTRLKIRHNSDAGFYQWHKITSQDKNMKAGCFCCAIKYFILLSVKSSLDKEFFADDEN